MSPSRYHWHRVWLDVKPLLLLCLMLATFLVAVDGLKQGYLP